MKKIFCIEDNLQEIYLIKHHLAEVLQEKFHFDYAQTLQAGIEKLQQENFNVIILDLGLSDSIGIPTIHRLRESIPDIPVIVFSADTHEDAAKAIIKGGAHAFVSKVYDHYNQIGKVIKLFDTLKGLVK